MPSLGLRMTETMRGKLRFLAEPERERACRFDCDFTVVDWRAFLRTGETRLEGRFACEDLLPPLVPDVPFLGELIIDPLRSRRLVYRFEFEGPEGRKLRFYGEKRLEVLRFPATVSTLHCRVFEDDLVIATGVMRFDFRDLAPFVLSARLVAV